MIVHQHTCISSAILKNHFFIQYCVQETEVLTRTPVKSVTHSKFAADTASRVDRTAPTAPEPPINAMCDISKLVEAELCGDNVRVCLSI